MYVKNDAALGTFDEFYSVRYCTTNEQGSESCDIVLKGADLKARSKLIEDANGDVHLRISLDFDASDGKYIVAMKPKGLGAIDAGSDVVASTAIVLGQTLLGPVPDWDAISELRAAADQHNHLLIPFSEGIAPGYATTVRLTVDGTTTSGDASSTEATGIITGGNKLFVHIEEDTRFTAGDTIEVSAGYCFIRSAASGVCAEALQSLVLDLSFTNFTPI